MTQALEARLGGSPFGPAGTGKTETVKALGNQLGRFVLVFNCDETFDFQVCFIFLISVKHFYSKIVIIDVYLKTHNQILITSLTYELRSIKKGIY